MKKRTFAYKALWIALLLSSSFLVIYSQAAAAGTLSFTSKHEGKSNLYLIDRAGQNLQKLETNNTNKSSHTWSPDGRFFAYHSNHAGSPDIYVMDIGNKETHKLIDHPSRDLYPAWSPNGKWIAFVSDRTGNMDIYRINVDGSNLRRLTNRGDNQNPAWSPDSQWIVYDSYRGGNHNAGVPGRHYLYRMAADGGRTARLRGARNLSGCTWAPDGKQIAFAAGNPGDQGINIYVMAADGDNLRKLTRVGAWTEASQPEWSPDGKWIAYAFKKMVRQLRPGERVPINEVFGDSAIYLVKATGDVNEPIEVANGFSLGLRPTWVPETFFSVSATAEKQITFWGTLKQPVIDSPSRH